MLFASKSVRKVKSTHELFWGGLSSLQWWQIRFDGAKPETAGSTLCTVIRTRFRIIPRSQDVRKLC